MFGVAYCEDGSSSGNHDRDRAPTGGNWPPGSCSRLCGGCGAFWWALPAPSLLLCPDWRGVGSTVGRGGRECVRSSPVGVGHVERRPRGPGPAVSAGVNVTLGSARAGLLVSTHVHSECVALRAVFGF